MPISSAPPRHGLVILDRLRPRKLGMNKSLSLAAPHLARLGLHLHFATARSVPHLLQGLWRAGRRRFDFVLFNSLAALTSGTRLGAGVSLLLAHAVLRLKVPTFIFWHESAWVFERLTRGQPEVAQRVDRLAADVRVVHLVASSACGASIRERYPQTDPVVVYECAIIPTPFDQPATPVTPPLVANVASIQPRKGTDLFAQTAIRVCQRHPTVEFIWLGQGPPFGDWQRRIAQSGYVHRILFPGHIPAPYLTLRRASTLFLSSRDDPFPLSVLEAMNLARSVVAFNVGGAAEALAGHGQIVPPFDVEAAADVILGLLARPPDQRLVPALRDRYLAHYTPERFAQRLNTIIRRRLGDDP